MYLRKPAFDDVELCLLKCEVEVTNIYHFAMSVE